MEGLIATFTKSEKGVLCEGVIILCKNFYNFGERKDLLEKVDQFGNARHKFHAIYESGAEMKSKREFDWWAFS